MGIREENAESFLEKINKIIPFLNGEDPVNLTEQDYGVPKRAKSKFFGPKAGVVIKNRHLLLLYVGKKRLILKGNSKEIEGLIYFSPTSFANYDAFNPDKIQYDRTLLNTI